VRVLAQPVAAGLRRLAREGCRPRFALLDPPRDGAGDAIESLAALGPERILYISCSPPTLVRDLRRLGARGFRVEWTRMADMFSQTAHVECLTLLRLGDEL
jgi:23S rRNA (uracil1939-C5)-methyltransferase